MTDTEILDWMEANLIQLNNMSAPLMGGQRWYCSFRNPESSGPGTIRGNIHRIRDLPTFSPVIVPRRTILKKGVE